MKTLSTNQVSVNTDNATPSSCWDTLAVWTARGGRWYHTPRCSAVRHLHVTKIRIGTVREALQLNRRGQADHKSRLPCRKCMLADPLGLVDAGHYEADPMIVGSAETSALTPFGRLVHHEMGLVLMAATVAASSPHEIDEFRELVPRIAVGYAKLDDAPSWRLIRPILDRLPCATALLQEHVDAEGGR